MNAFSANTYDNKNYVIEFKTYLIYKQLVYLIDISSNFKN